MNNQILRRSWVEIDLRQLVKNLKIYRAHMQGSAEICAVVKADAYGHGDVRVAQTLQKAGITHFAVSNVCEAITLREAGIEGMILVLGYTPPSCIRELLHYDITQALVSEEYAQAFYGSGLKAQYAIDTGMNRIGLDAQMPEECEAAVRRAAKELQLTGLFTHLSCADMPEEDPFTNGQLAAFDRIVRSVGDLKLEYIHAMNSAGGLWHAPYGDLVRLGILMYGLKPGIENRLPEGIEPVLTWKSVISLCKTVRKGESIGYGRTFVCPGDMRVATIPTGYADGYQRALARNGYVLIHGKKARILGTVCMDQMMVDVTDIPEAAEEDEVILLGKDLTADELAHAGGTIGYELICGISKRVPRIYTDYEE